jgi:hypothetical protein
VIHLAEGVRELEEKLRKANHGISRPIALVDVAKGFAARKTTRLWRDDVTSGLLLDGFAAIASKVSNFDRG